MRVEYRDFGTFSDEPVDYPDFIAPVARAVARGDFDFGIVLGGSGTGEAIVANKVRGIRCVQATNPVVARLRASTTTPTSSRSGRIVGTEVARACARAWPLRSRAVATSRGRRSPASRPRPGQRMALALDDHERAMLAGEHGEGAALAPAWSSARPKCWAPIA